MGTVFFRLSLAARVTFGAMAMVVLIAVAVTWFIVHKDRETYLADRARAYRLMDNLATEPIPAVVAAIGVAPAGDIGIS